MFLQLLVLGLPIIPGSINHYLQAKVKQYIINPIMNFLYIIFIETAKWIATAFYLAIWSIGYFIFTVLQTLISDFTWGIKRFWWYTPWLGYFIKQFVYCIYVVISTVAWWTLQDIYWLVTCICAPFIWLYTTGIWLYTSGTYMWAAIYKFIVDNLQTAAIYVWEDIVLLFTIMWFVFKLAILAVFSGLTIYLAVIIYRFFSRCDFTLQYKYYFGPTPPPGRNQEQGVLTIAPIMLDPKGRARV